MAASILLAAFTVTTGAGWLLGQSPSDSPLPGPLVFTQLERFHTAAAGPEPRSRLIRLDPDGALRPLTAGFYAARDPDVSFDGRRILFAGKRAPGDYWQIYEMRADGTALRRVTSETMDCRLPIYQSTLYTITSEEPWRQFAFVGSAPGGIANLFSARLDGTAVRQITFNPYGVADPAMAPDGRILFTSRQRNRLEPGPTNRAGLFGVNLDGTDYAVFSADEGAAYKRMAAVTPNRLVVFVESDDPQWDGAGWLAAVTLRRNLHSHRRLTEPGRWLYHSPSPLPSGEILVSRRPAQPGGMYVICRFDPATGRTAVLHQDPGYHNIQAKLIAPRPEPDGRSSVVSDDVSTGVLYCLSVYTTDFPSPDWLPYGAARRLRVVEGRPRSDTGAAPAKRMLGEIDLEPDGSFQIRVPANIPIELQLLDEHGMSLRNCSWIWVRNNEPRGCIGCHEDQELTPENRLPAALRRPAISLTLPAQRRRTVTYDRDVRPVIESRCATAECHAGAVRPMLSDAARARVHVAGAARTSPLVWSLFGRKTLRPWDGLQPDGRAVRLMPPAGTAPLTDDEIRTIIEWIDLGAE